LLENIAKFVPDTQVMSIPRRPYCQGATVPVDATGRAIRFATIDGEHFPAALALAGECGRLAGGDDVSFTEEDQIINLRIEVFVLHVILTYR